MNRRNFFTWIAAAIGWLGMKPKTHCTCGFVVCGECGPKVRPSFTKEWTLHHRADSASEWRKISLQNPVITWSLSGDRPSRSAAASTTNTPANG